ncbi:uncharacterized protein [Drosophila tropicalis]|uniref:uncharacterized protein n=1 Tax=Drosophila tropicalis TaxID=46794 RepID=UPI0035AB895B
MRWMSSVGLSLAAQKTEAVLISSRKIVETATILIDGNTVQSKRAIRYLGDHAEHEGPQAGVQEAANDSQQVDHFIRGPDLGTSHERRQLYKRNQIIALAKRAANLLGFSHSIRRSGTCDRRSGAYRPTGKGGAARDPTLEASIDLWQARWDASDKGRWTHRLIPNIRKWTERPHGTVNFYLTQFLSGHGCFRQYLHRFGHDSSQCCPICPGEIVEDALHILFACSRFDNGRRALEREANVEICAENLVDLMVARKSMWEAVNSFAASTIRELRLAERGRPGPGAA